MNIVNPALLTRAILFFAYPSKMSGTDVWISNLTNNTNIIDGFSGATILGELGTATTAEQITQIQEKFSIMTQLMGNMAGSIGETSIIAIMIGAAILLFTKIASWKTMLAGFAGGAVIAILFNVIGANPYMTLPWYQHLLIGGFAFGMVFMLTDPVSSAQTETGKWIYGFLAGAIAIIIRVVNPAYPEGVMLAILLMNIFAPLIDYYVVNANIKKRLKRVKTVKVETTEKN